MNNQLSSFVFIRFFDVFTRKAKRMVNGGVYLVDDAWSHILTFVVPRVFFNNYVEPNEEPNGIRYLTECRNMMAFAGVNSQTHRIVWDLFERHVAVKSQNVYECVILSRRVQRSTRNLVRSYVRSWALLESGWSWKLPSNFRRIHRETQEQNQQERCWAPSRKGVRCKHSARKDKTTCHVHRRQNPTMPASSLPKHIHLSNS